MNRLNTILKDMAYHSEATGSSFLKLSESFRIFIESIEDFKRTQSKRSYKKPLKTKQIIELLKFTRI